MVQATLGDVLRYLRQAYDPKRPTELRDGELLDRFLSRREESAFTLLVQRHGPMVLGVCQRVLGDIHAAEDSFQATFLVLVRQAGSIRKRGSLGSWLHGVALRIATRARAQASMRRRRERQLTRLPPAEAFDALSWQELRNVLDEELGRLPQKYRTALVLCHLEGRTMDQAAQELGCPRGTLANRVARGGQLLRRQLAGRGFALSAGALVAGLNEKTSAAVPALLTINTVHAATFAASGPRSAGAISGKVAELAEGAIAGMQPGSQKLVIACLFTGLVLAGVGLAVSGVWAEKPAAAVATQAPTTQGEPKREPTKDSPRPVDLHGDPLAEGVVARLGTVRFRPGGSWSLAFAHGGNFLVSVGNTTCLMDAVLGQPLHRLLMTNIGSAAFSPDDKTLFLSNLSLIDVATGKERRRLQGPAGRRFFGTAWSPDGHILAASEFDTAASAIILWDQITGKELRRLEGHDAGIWSVAFTPDGKLLASASIDKTVRVWEMATGKETLRLPGSAQKVQSIAFSPTDKILAAAGEGGTVALWDLGTGKLRHELKADQAAFRCFAFAPDGKRLVTGDDRGLIRIWDPGTGKEVRRWFAHWGVYAVAFAPTGKAIASAGAYDHAVRLWDPSTGEPLSPADGHTGMIESLRFAPDGKSLFSTGWDRKALEWDLTTNRVRRQLGSGAQVAETVKSQTTVQAISHDGKLFAWTVWGPRTEKPDYRIHIWDIAQAKELCVLSGHSEPVRYPPHFLPAGNRLVSAAKDGVRIWDVTKGKELHHLAGPLGGWEIAAVSQDGTKVAYLTEDMTLHLCNLETGKESRQWPSEHTLLALLALSADGKLLASAQRSVIRVWDTDTGKLLARMDGGGFIDALMFSKSGRILATSGRDFLETANGDLESPSKISLWEVLSGQAIRSFPNPDWRTSALAFTPDDRMLASGSDFSAILLWDMTQAAKSKPAPLTATDLAALWSDLAGDAAKADRAIWTLALAPSKSVPLLKERLRPVTPAAREQIAKLVADLDSESFALRSKAGKSLDDLGEAAEAAVRKLMDGKLTLEVRKRLDQFLEKQNTEAFRKLRALDALEHAGTPEARQVLEAVSKSAANPRIAESAGAALNRLATR
jgi:RNA polymerase sigma factor (sigma-70 family)